MHTYQTTSTALTGTRATFDIGGLAIPEDVNQPEWELIHRNILLCKKAASKWLKQSRQYATCKWGVQYAANAELQLEMDLGLPQLEEKLLINPSDKSTALVTIEGINQSFTLWKRKMDGKILDFSPVEAKRAVELLEPMAKQYEELKRMIE
jgi:hypothetical protein